MNANFSNKCITNFKPLLISGLICTSLANASEKKPNIIFILADDWGWTDWQMNGDKFGSTFYETPNLNKLASQGVYFSQAYATPLSSPSRAALLTGKYPGARLHMHQAITGASKPNPILPESARPNLKTCFPESSSHLALEEITIAEELQKAGYTNSQFGKWHLGNEPFFPKHQGFDSQFAVGGAGPGPSYFAPFARLSDIAQGYKDEYITERLTDEVCNRLEQVKNKSFFIYLAHFNVHSPYQAKADLVAKYTAKSNPNNPHHHPVMAAMIESLDASVGKVMDKLTELGLDKNTLVIVMGDNGGVHWNNDKSPKYKDMPVTSNQPLRAGKCCFYEGGVRVPLIIRFPKMIKTGRVENTPVHLVDFYPTLLQLAKTKASKEKDVLDGLSILPLLSGKGKIPKRPIFCHFPRAAQIGAEVGGSSIRLGNYKLYRLYGANADATDSYELYNLANDIGETKDVSNELPEICKKMKAELNSWLINTKALIPHKNPAWDINSVKKQGIEGENDTE